MFILITNLLHNLLLCILCNKNKTCCVLSICTGNTHVVVSILSMLQVSQEILIFFSRITVKDWINNILIRLTMQSKESKWFSEYIRAPWKRKIKWELQCFNYAYHASSHFHHFLFTYLQLVESPQVVYINLFIIIHS